MASADDGITITGGVASGNRVDYDLSINGRSYHLYFASDDVKLNASAESAVAMGALGGMKNGLDLHIIDPISSAFIHNQQRLIETFTDWFPSYQKIKLVADTAIERDTSKTGRVGSFFTGGVDSFYTFIKNKSDITDLIYVHGYDVKLTDTPRRAAIAAMGRAIQAETGVRFVQIETNSIRVYRDYGRWGAHGHGYGLGAVARQLSDYLDRLYIPSSLDYKMLTPWGSHPDTDPLFSDERLEIIHDGCETSRFQKTKMIAKSNLALNHLRVCWDNVTGTYNCERCEKCLRTKTSLFAVGALDNATTFTSMLQAEDIRKLVIYDELLTKLAQDNILAMRSAGLSGTDIYQAWQHIVDRPKSMNKIIMKGRRVGSSMRRIVRIIQRKISW